MWPLLKNKSLQELFMIKMKRVLHFRSPFLLSAIFMLLSSCSIYKQQFDCPPPAGIPCASVTEIESIIVETEKGSDLIIKPEVEETNHCFWCGAQKAVYAFPSKNSKCNRKVWICSQKNEDYLIKGHYFQQSDASSSCSDVVIEPEDFFFRNHVILKKES